MTKKIAQQSSAFILWTESFVPQINSGVRVLGGLALIAFVLAMATPAWAANLYWVGTTPGATVGTPGNGNWNTTTAAWDNTTGDNSNPANAAYVSGSTANFGGSGSYVATLTATLTGANNLVYFNGGTPTLAGAFTLSVQNTLAIQVASGVTATISKTTIDVNTGTYTVGKSGGASAGTLVLTNGAVLRSSNSGYGVAVDGNGMLLDVLTGSTYANTSTGGGGGTLTIGAGSGANSTVQVDGGTVSVGGINMGLIVGGSGAGTLTLNTGVVSMPAGSVKSLTLANGLSGSGTVNLNGGTLSVSNVVKFIGGPAIFNFNGGTLKANQNCPAFLSGLDAANVLGGGAVINNNGKNIAIDQVLLNGTNDTDGGLTSLGAGTLTLTGANMYNGPTTVSAGKLVTTSASIGGGAYSVADGAALEVQVNTPGTSLMCSSLTLGTAGTATCNFTLGANASTTIPAIADAGGLNLNGTVVVNVTASGLSGGSTNLLLSYDSLAGSGLFVAGTLPVVNGSTVALVNDTANKQLKLVVIVLPVSVQWSAGNGNWDTNTLNWQPLGGGDPTNYAEYAFTAFNDSASGTSPITVTLTGDHNPSVINNTSSSLDYIFAGSGYNFTGASLIKDGSSTLILDNGNGNNFTAVTINNGTLQVGNNDGSGSLGFAGVADNGTLAFDRTDDLILANVISGTGGVTQAGSGPVILSAANTYSGTTAINAGQLILSNSAAVQASVVANNISNGLQFASGLTASVVGGLAGSGDIVLTNADSVAFNLIVGGTTTNTYSGRLQGGILTQTNTGTLILANDSAIDSFGLGNAIVSGNVVVSNAALTVGNGAGDSLIMGSGNVSAAMTGTLNVSGSTAFTVNVGTLAIGTNSANSGGNPTVYNTTLNLGTNNTITSATAIVVGDSAGIIITSPSQQKAIITTAAGGNTAILTPAFNLGGRKFNASFTLGNGAALNLGNVNNRSSLGVGNAAPFGQSGTSSSFSGTLDLSAGVFAGYLSSLAVGTINNNGTGGETGILTLSTNPANHLEISGAGSVVLIGTNAGVNTATATGTVTIGNLDGTSRVTSTDDSPAILLGANLRSTGTLNLNGGTLTITTAGPGIAGGTGVSTNNLNGVTLQAGTNSAAFISGLTAANVLSNGVVVNDGGYTVAIPQALAAGDAFGGGFVKQGAGTLTLYGANTYTGETVVSNGTLLVNGSIAGDAVAAAGTLGGNGIIGGSVVVNPGSTLSPGITGSDALTISGNLTVNGNLDFALNKSLTPSNSLCLVSGTINNAGTGTLTITNLGPWLAVGDKFTLFNQPVPNGAALTIVPPGGVTFTNNLAVDGSIQVLSAPATAANPTNLVLNVSGNTLTLSWPADHLGWIAQSNNVSLTAIGSWYDIPGSQNGTNCSITVDSSEQNVFYRLRHP
ncbi:MAG TPA: autotransporter-associated beta strand repeat-containing protein [Verrucomicrobiae bacterium]|jgi:autotransporter-associated beta strand protein